MAADEPLDHQNIHASKKRQNGQKRTVRPNSSNDRATPTKINHGIPVSQRTTDSATEDESPMAMFQQFCASCEKQMKVNNPSILYCSDKCRRQDSAYSQSLPLFKTDIPSPPSLHQMTSFDDIQPRDIVPQMSPTLRTKSSITYFSYNDTEHHLPQSTMDAIAASPQGNQPYIGRRDSEAARFLATFNSENHDRTYYSRRGSNTPAEPSLSTSLTPVSSTSGPYTPAESHSSARRTQRPPPNPRWSSTSFSNRSVDLIIPVSHSGSLLTSTDAALDGHNYRAHAVHRPTTTAEWRVQSDEHLAYAKRAGLDTISPRDKSSLKPLFWFDEMRSEPSPVDSQRKRSSQTTRSTGPFETFKSVASEEGEVQEHVRTT